jgi:hypothetical protein
MWRNGFFRRCGERMNSKGKKFASYYHFATCGDHLVLVGIGENPM